MPLALVGIAWAHSVGAGVDRFVRWQLDFLVAQPAPRPAVNFLHVRYVS